MFKLLVIVAATVAVVTAGGAGDVDEALLARVAQILSQNEGSSGGGFSSGGGGFSSGSARAYSPPSNSYGAPPPSNSYGAPSRVGGGGGGGLQIGQPERAQRIAEFDLSSASGGFRSGGGGYSGGSSGGYN